MDKLFEHTQAALVAHFQQAGQHGLTIVTVVLLDPLLDLLASRDQAWNDDWVAGEASRTALGDAGICVPYSWRCPG